METSENTGRIEDFFFMSNDLMTIIDSQGVALKVNNAWEDLLGYPPSELLGLNLLSLVHPDDLPATQETLSKVVNGESIKGFCIRYQAKNGNFHHLEWRGASHNGLVYAVARDVSDALAAQDQLRQSEEMLYNLTNNLPGLILQYILYPDGSDDISFISEGVASLYEISKEEALEDLGKIWTKVLPEDIPGFAASIQQSAKDLSPWVYEWRAKMDDGRLKWITGRGMPVRLKNGATRWDSLLLDVTERKNATLKLQRTNEELLAMQEKLQVNLKSLQEAKQALELQRNQLSLIFEAANLGTWDWNILTGHTIYNDQWSLMLGLDPKEITPHASTFLSMIHPSDLPKIEKHLAEQKKGTLTFFQEEIRMKTKNGQWKWVLDTGKVINRDSQGRGIRAIGIHLDIHERKMAEEKLIANEERFRTMVENSHDIFMISNSTEILFVTPNIYQILGYSVKEFTDIASLELIHPEDVPNIPWHHLNAPGKTLEVTYRMKHKNGQWRWMETFGINLHHVKHIEGRVFNLRDITLRKNQEQVISELNENLEAKIKIRTAELRKNQKLMEEAQSLANLGSWEMDVATQKVFWSPQLYNIFGLPKGEEAPSYLEQESFFHPNDWEKLSNYVQKSIEAGEPYQGDMTIIRPTDKQERYVYVKGMAIKNDEGQVARVVGICMDITRRKLAEQEMRIKTQQLEASVKELEAFSYAVSHDLRAPLRGIDGWSQALQEDFEDILGPAGKQMVARIRGESQRMGELIDDLLKLAKISRAELSMYPVDFSALAKQIAKRLQEQHPERDIHFSIAEGLKAFGDERLIEVALNNLMHNAVKFTSKKVSAKIVVGQKTWKGQEAFFVADNGAGFNLATAKKLFGAFQRFHRQADFPGSGIGLATVKRIITLHGGKIWAEAAIDQGATFYFTLES